MDAVILAAGIGRRMRPLSDDGHKGLLTIGDETILDRLVSGLLTIDVDRITVVTGYRADEVEGHLSARWPADRIFFVRNEHYATTNNVVSLAIGLAALDDGGDEPVIVAECDLVLDPKVLRLLRTSPPGNIALVDHYRTGMDGTVVSVRHGHVEQVFPQDRQDTDFAYTDMFKTLNVYRFSRAFCRRTLAPLVRWYADEVDAGSYYELVLGMLAGLPQHHIAAVVVPAGAWVEVDDPNDVTAARFRFEPDRRHEILDRSLGGLWGLDLLDFAFLRNVHFPPPAMIAALRYSLPELLSGYGSSQRVLDEKLAWFLGCGAGEVHLLNGAAQAFPILADLFRDEVVALPRPTFGEWPRAFPHARTYADSPDALGTLDRVAGEVDVLVVVNPNNPTGTTLPTAGLHRLAARHPGTRLVVDESFVDFSDQPSLRAALAADPLPNVAVLTSLSKSLGVPGVRLGHLFTQDRVLLDAVGSRLPIWNCSGPAEHVLELLLKFRPELAASLERTRADRALLRADLADLAGVARVPESGGNFLLVELDGTPGRAQRLRRAVLEHDALDVKDVTAKFDDGRPRLRVAVRSEADNALLLAALDQHLPNTQAAS